MQDFKENCCRLCMKVFCCTKCRASHEDQIHKVNTQCEICIYGRMTIKDAPISLLNHIKSSHWPLHCIFCKNIFGSMDELITHNKCAMGVDGNQLTPKTPETPFTENEPSPNITPFYKSMPLQIRTELIRVTSTPLHKQDDKESDKVTPVNSIESKSIFKSSLKLTSGSANLNDSKRSDRRVTFSETPSVSEPFMKPKLLPMIQLNEGNPEEIAGTSTDSIITDDSYVSLVDEEEVCKIVSSVSTIDEGKENCLDANAPPATCDSVKTTWHSALTNLDMNTTNCRTSQVKVSLQINVFNNTVTSNDSSNINDCGRTSNSSFGIWSSMTNVVKAVVNNISFSAQSSFRSVGVKRSLPDNDSSVGPHFKRMKLTELKCRRPIRDLSPVCQIRLVRGRYVDKATQTDDWLC